MLANERVRDSDSKTSNLLGITKKANFTIGGFLAGFHQSPLIFLFVFSGFSHKLIKARDFQPSDITGFINVS